MISPDALIDHARRLAGSGPGRPADVDLRRGVSAAYYAIFHDLTGRAASHLIGSADVSTQSAIRRTWSHGELASLGTIVVERVAVLARTPLAPPTKELRAFGPLLDLAARDPNLVACLRDFMALQGQRHRADYDHEATFDKASLLAACTDAATARTNLQHATAAAQEGFFALLTLRRPDFRAR